MSYLEKEILGCFLKDNTLLKETVINKSHFAEEQNKIVYESMMKLAQDNKAVDQVTLLSTNYDYIQQLGGPDFITKLEMTGDVEHFESYEREFIDQFKQRESERIIKSWLSKSDKDNQELISELQQLDDVGFSDEPDKNETLKDMHDEPYHEKKETGTPSGLSDLDSLTGGFQNQNSYVMGARPSMGKTATMLKFALSAAQNDKVPLMFSLEMSEKSLLRRLIATVGNINLFLTKNPNKLIESKKEQWKKAVNALYTLDFEIYDKPMQTIQYIRSKIRKAKKKHEGKQIIVLIDYMTLINNAGTFHSDHAKVSDISARLKAMAKEYDCPVITLAQLSRGVESRQDKRPMLSDIRESGSIEQDADMVMFLYRDSYYNQENPDDELEVIVAKHRDGPTGSVKVYYNKATGKMGDLH
ncbi:replicative DNA helicase [Virgibacillus natechei]|uniref:DNA 5'-3' helicase n=1 Tax=Virgibacillus natechei TaxID=1216297 RepID=A0ABS4IKW9_9BACI|nr:DnaB-like helicase C-terminal domain-containing protein [Virgibacillus natechei]MBP1971617.1 replicative DNA helicase [Virgibacillus natechei]UZD13055.1 DNA helicase [Virgibacillus natechei]